MTRLRWFGCASGLLLLGGMSAWWVFSRSSLTPPHVESYTVTATEFSATGTFVCMAGTRDILISLPQPSASQFSTVHITKGDDGPGQCLVTLHDEAIFGSRGMTLVLARRGMRLWVTALKADNQWVYAWEHSEERPEGEVRE